jgi:hypothetical protein
LALAEPAHVDAAEFFDDTAGQSGNWIGILPADAALHGTCALKSAGEANRRPGRNEVSR